MPQRLLAEAPGAAIESREMTMTMPAPGWSSLREDGNLRGGVISVLAILIAALLIAAIEKSAPTV